MKPLPYQERIVEEKEQLEDRLSKLKKFLAVPPISITRDQQDDLIEQKCAMSLYLAILNRRISKF